MFENIRNVIAAGLLVSATVTVAQAETLKFAHPFPANHFLWNEGGKVFADAVEKATDGRIVFEVYPARQLGKDLIATQQSGLADLAVIVPAYTPENLPLSSVAELPGMYKNSCPGAELFWNAAKPGAILDELELKSQGFRVLFVSAIPTLKLLTKDKKISTLDDLKGLKIRAAGSAMNKTVRVLGATPIALTANEMFDSISRGTVDGAMWYYHSTPTFGLETVLTHAVDGVELGGGTVLYTISDAAWERLTADDQSLVVEAAAAAQATLCEWLDNEEARVRQDLVANYGWNITILPTEEAAKWAALISQVSAEWATELDDHGKPGSKVLEAIRNDRK